MEVSSASDELDANFDDPLTEIPILDSITRKERDEPDRPTFVRDFAYTADNPLFWLLDDETKSGKRSSIKEPSYTTTNQASGDDELPDGSGFTGAPPWLQSTTNEGGLAEEDPASHALDDELHGRAVALFDFAPEHENEFPLNEGQIMYISSRHGLGWLVAVDLQSGDCGLVPEEYVRLLEVDEEGYIDDDDIMRSNTGERNISDDSSKRQSAQPHETSGNESTDDWVDEPDINPGEVTSQSGQGSSAAQAGNSAQEMTDEERQKILDAAEREMALVDARLREEM